MKLGVIVDSSCGLTKKEAESKGWHYLPLYFSIDGKEYADGIDIEPDEYFAQLNIKQDVKTSSTPPGAIMDMFKKVSKMYDFIIMYGLSTGLSSQTQNLMNFAKDYKNIHVVDSKSVGYAITKDLDLIEKLAKEGYKKEDLIKQVEFLTREQIGIAIPKTMKWLVKGGRVSPAAAAMANMMKITPMISFKDGKLDKYGKGRIFNKTYEKSVKSLQKDLSDKINDGVFMIYVALVEDEKKLIESTKKILNLKNIEIYNMPPIIVNHTGPVIATMFYSSKKII